MKIMLHRFVEFIPEKIEEGIIYISTEFATATHKCVCGCGNLVVTPLSPTDWELRFNGETVSLYPSIGNWSFECRSHYWIEKSKIIFARDWDEDEIEENRQNDHLKKKKWYKKMKK